MPLTKYTKSEDTQIIEPEEFDYEFEDLSDLEEIPEFDDEFLD